MSIANSTTLEDSSSTENTYLEEKSKILEENGSILVEDINNQSMENEKMVPWQMFRHAIEQVKFFMVLMTGVQMTSCAVKLITWQ